MVNYFEQEHTKSNTISIPLLYVVWIFPRFYTKLRSISYLKHLKLKNLFVTTWWTFYWKSRKEILSWSLTCRRKRFFQPFCWDRRKNPTMKTLPMLPFLMSNKVVLLHTILPSCDSLEINFHYLFKDKSSFIWKKWNDFIYTSFKTIL